MARQYETVLIFFVCVGRWKKTAAGDLIADDGLLLVLSRFQKFKICCLHILSTFIF